jgi:DHA1 family multidrug resistance protein-like MFS transporter
VSFRLSFLRRQETIVEALSTAGRPGTIHQNYGTVTQSAPRKGRHVQYYKRNLIVLSVTVFMAAVGWNQLLPFLPQFLKELGVTRDLPFWSGVIFAIQWVSMIIMSLVWGKISDKYGRKPMIIRAGVALVFIYTGMSFCQNIWQLAVLRILNGALTGFIPSSITLVATNTPKELSGRYVSIIQSAVAAGAIAGPAIGGILAEVIGYRHSMLVSGLILFAATCLVMFFVEERNQVTITESSSILEDCRTGFSKPPLVTAMLGDMAIGMILAAALPILSLYLSELIGRKADAINGFVYALPGVAIAMTAYFWSRRGERVTYPRNIVTGLIGAGIFMCCAGLTRNIFLFCISYFCAGIFAAAVNPSTAALVATKVGGDFRGRAYGMLQSGRQMGMLIAPILAGVIGNFLGLRWVFIIIGVVGLILAAGLWRQIAGWERKEPARPKAGAG